MNYLMKYCKFQHVQILCFDGKYNWKEGAHFVCKIYHNLFLITLFLVLSSCVKHDAKKTNKDMSLFVYILSDNDLDDHADYIESDMVKGLKGCPAGTEIFLYVDRQNKKPCLRQLLLLEPGKVGVKIISEYEEHYSTSPEVFREVLNTMISKSSGRQYGLIYWSHGNGWLPGISPDNASFRSTRALGADGMYSMDIDDMNDILSGKREPFFIVLDACFMGAVEVAYSLRNSTDYLIASSSETLGVGFPYHLMLPELVKGNTESFIQALNIYWDYCYTDYYGDGIISGMASLIDCSQVESLASAYKGVLEHIKDNISKDDIQAYDCSYPHLYYDLDDYAHAITDDSLSLALFEKQLEKTVVHKVSTPSVFTQTSGRDSMLAINHFSGLSTYIPGTSIGYDYAYMQTAWYKNCYGE